MRESSGAAEDWRRTQRDSARGLCRHTERAITHALVVLTGCNVASVYLCSSHVLFSLAQNLPSEIHGGFQFGARRPNKAAAAAQEGISMRIQSPPTAVHAVRGLDATAISFSAMRARNCAIEDGSQQCALNVLRSARVGL